MLSPLVSLPLVLDLLQNGLEVVLSVVHHLLLDLELFLPVPELMVPGVETLPRDVGEPGLVVPALVPVEGHLGRPHEARWVYLPDGKRLVLAHLRDGPFVHVAHEGHHSLRVVHDHLAGFLLLGLEVGHVGLLLFPESLQLLLLFQESLVVIHLIIITLLIYSYGSRVLPEVLCGAQGHLRPRVPGVRDPQ